MTNHGFKPSTSLLGDLSKEVHMNNKPKDKLEGSMSSLGALYIYAVQVAVGAIRIRIPLIFLV